jgi:hypothetical protein
LALTILSETDAAWLSARRPFYWLDRRRKQLAGDAELSQEFPLAVAGAIGEWSLGTQESEGRRKKEIGSIFLATKVVETRCDSNFDYFLADVDYTQDANTPESFGGISGCGVWQLRASATGAELSLDEVFLVGIVYAQSDRDGQRRRLFCHGPRSVYDWTATVGDS